MALFGIGRAVPVVVRIEANVQWQIFRDPASEEWIGVCQALNLNAIGETFEDFFDCANEATQLLLTELLEKGELQAFLRRQGWTPSAMPTPGSPVRWDVPFEMRPRARFEELEPQLA